MYIQCVPMSLAWHTGLENYYDMKHDVSLFLSHGMSYSISGLVKSFTTSGYDPKKPLVVSLKCMVND